MDTKFKKWKEFLDFSGTLSFYNGNVRRKWKKHQAIQNRQTAIARHRNRSKILSAATDNIRKDKPKSREMMNIRNIITGTLDESPVNPGKIWHRL